MPVEDEFAILVVEASRKMKRSAVNGSDLEEEDEEEPDFEMV